MGNANQIDFSGNTLVVDAIRVGASSGQVGRGVIPTEGEPTSLATVGAGTYTAAMLLTGLIVRDCAGASRVDTLDTAANIVAAIPGVAVGDVLECRVINGSDPVTEIITLAAGSGGAFDANQTAVSRTILGSSQKVVCIRITDVTTPAYVVYA